MTIPPLPSTPPPPGAPPGGVRDAAHAGRRRSLVRSGAPWLLSLALFVTAWGLTQAEKPEDAVYDSFSTSSAVGERAQTRNLSATVTDVRAARAISDGAGWRADGTWLVVDVDAASVETESVSTLHAELRMGERLFTATERGQTARMMRLVTGVPRHGSLAFELPEGSLKGRATLVLSWQPDSSADGVIEVGMDLDDVPVEGEVTLHEIGWAR